MRRSITSLMVVALLSAGVANMFHTLTASAQGQPSGQTAPGGPGGRGPGAPGGPGGPPRKFVWDPAHADTQMVHLLDDIKGREDMPAESVYKNIKILKGMPAKSLPAIMVMGFQRGVGMGCLGCHVRGDMASDEKPNKRVAREMWAMSKELNNRILPAIKDLEGDTPIVNCWTCHRGQHEPATNADADSSGARPGGD